MASTITLIGAGLVTLQLVRVFVDYRRNFAKAKATGLVCISMPVYVVSMWWVMTQKLFLPLLQSIPKALTEPWIRFMHPEWHLRSYHDRFAELGTDTFMAVAPGRNMLYTCDADVIAQISTRKNDFLKPVEMYQALDIFGSNVVSSEGSVWRHHRKITTAPFTEKSNAVVFKESVSQAESMLKSWTTAHPEGTENSSPTIKDTDTATMRLTLHVISRAGFGVELLWPHEEKSGSLSEQIPPGHTMGFRHSLEMLLRNIFTILILPKWFLTYSPFKKLRQSGEAHSEWRNYMNEMYQSKRSEIEKGTNPDTLDLMGALIQGAGPPSAEDPNKRSFTLNESEVLGNAFVFLLAGHETTANTLHFTFNYLALHPESQRKLQEQLDHLGFTETPLNQWDYDRDILKLQGGMAGAIMSEILRLVPPIANTIRVTKTSQPLTVNGQRTVIPVNTAVCVLAAPAHRNPNFWPSISDPPTKDLYSFRPERWLNPGGKASEQIETETAENDENQQDQEGTEQPEGIDSVEGIFKPRKGAYFPFNEGPRSCLGKRFAQVEMLVVLGVIFRNYSVELAVDEWATDAEVEAMPRGGPERAKLYQKAQDRGHYMFRNKMETIFTMMMLGHIPVRFVKRGHERFI